MKIKLLNILRRIGKVIIMVPLLLLGCIIMAATFIPFWVITGNSILEDSIINDLMQDLYDFFDNEIDEHHE